MKPSIYTMLQKPYKEALDEIEKKISSAIHKKNSYPKRNIQKKYTLEYILKTSDKNHPAIIIDMQDK
ncbi:MAG: hypothetical protein U9P44_01170, partial [archaeon]|nr:hypothetical protein [archaeon]